MEFLTQIEGNFLLWVQQFLRQEWMTPFWKMITFLGDRGWFWIALGLGLLLFKETRRAGTAVLLALLINALITNVTLKPLIARIRPYEAIEGLMPLVGPQRDFSFPSGHASASFAAATACWKLLPGKYGKPLLILAALIAFSRLYLGVHYPTDVIAGVAIGVFAAWAAVNVRKAV